MRRKCSRIFRSKFRKIFREEEVFKIKFGKKEKII